MSAGDGGLGAKLCLTRVTSWTCSCQGPLSLGFSRQEYWSGFLFPSPGDFPDPGIEPRFPALQTDFSPTELREKPRTKRVLSRRAEQENGNWGFPGGPVVKNPPCNATDTSSILVLGRSHVQQAN